MPSKVFRYSILSTQFIFATVIFLTSIGCRQSEPIPAEIVGDSMAPRLCGAHLSQRCPQCDFAFVCRTDQDLKTVQCSHCGAQFAPQAEVLPADRVQVMPGQTPQRWDIIAFEHNDSTMIKRVVGLPGETISLAGGNVIIDQNVAAKPPAIALQTRHLVFDSDQRGLTLSNAPAHYEFNSDHWKFENGAIAHRKRESPNPNFDWINYRHQRNYPHFEKTASEATGDQWPAIQDNNSFNQNVGRKLNDVHELTVQWDLKVRNGSTFKVQRRLLHATYFLTLSVDLNSDRFDIAFSDGKPITSAHGKCASDGDGAFEVSLLFSNIDGRVKVEVDGDALIDERDREVFDVLERVRAIAEPEVLDDQNEAQGPRAPELKFGFGHSSWGTVSRCRIWRDIHYFAAEGPPKFSLPLTLGQGDYFVMGDNVAVSRDSRHFGPIKKVIGVVQDN